METSNPLSSEKVREKASQICAEYLQGVWRCVLPCQLKIRQISGGLSNLVFYVGLPPEAKPKGREPEAVLLRLFGDLSVGPQHQYRILTETVVFTMLAERGLGPALHSVFPGGRLEGFIYGHSMSLTEMMSVKYSAEIARNVALIHCLDVPVSKEPSWLHDSIRGYQNKLRPIRLNKIPDEEKAAAAVVAGVDLNIEVDWLLGLILSLGSKVVFSHNDINTGNILVRDEEDSCDPVVLIDFEFSSYNYQGFDIANHFNEWMYDYRRKDYPYYYRNTDKYPSLEEQRKWVRTYVTTFRDQQEALMENNCMKMNILETKIPTEEDILREIPVFCLASHLLWTLWSLKQAQDSSIPFAYYSFAKDRIEDYWQKKGQVLQDFGS